MASLHSISENSPERNKVDDEPLDGSLSIDTTIESFLINALKTVADHPISTARALLDVLTLPKETYPFQTTVTQALTFLGACLNDMPPAPLGIHSIPPLIHLPISSFDLPSTELPADVLETFRAALAPLSLDFALSVTSIIEVQHLGVGPDHRPLAGYCLLLLHERVDPALSVAPTLRGSVPDSLLSSVASLLARQAVVRHVPSGVTLSTDMTQGLTSSLSGLLVMLADVVASSRVDSAAKLHTFIEPLLNLEAARAPGTTDGSMLLNTLCLYTIASASSFATDTTAKVQRHLLTLAQNMADPPPILIYAGFLPCLGHGLTPSIQEECNELKRYWFERVINSNDLTAILSVLSYAIATPSTRPTLTAAVLAPLKLSGSKWGMAETVVLAAAMLDSDLPRDIAPHTLPLTLQTMDLLDGTDGCGALVVSYCLYKLGSARHSLDQRMVRKLLDATLDVPRFPRSTLYSTLMHGIVCEFFSVPKVLAYGPLTDYTADLTPVLLLHYISTARCQYPVVSSNLLQTVFRYHPLTTSKLCRMLTPIATSLDSLEYIPAWLAQIFDTLFVGRTPTEAEYQTALDHAAILAPVAATHERATPGDLLKAQFTVLYALGGARPDAEETHVLRYATIAKEAGATLEDMLNVAKQTPLATLTSVQASCFVRAVSRVAAEAAVSHSDGLPTIVQLLRLPHSAVTALTTLIHAQIKGLDLSQARVDEIHGHVQDLLSFEDMLPDKTIAVLLDQLAPFPALRRDAILSTLSHRPMLVKTLLPVLKELRDPTILRSTPELKSAVAAAAVSELADSTPDSDIGQLVTLALEDNQRLPDALVVRLLTRLADLPVAVRSDAITLLLRAPIYLRDSDVDPAALTQVLCTTPGGLAVLGSLYHQSPMAVDSGVLARHLTTSIDEVGRLCRSIQDVTAATTLLAALITESPLSPALAPVIWTSLRLLAGIYRVPNVTNPVSIHKKVGIIPVTAALDLLASMAPMARQMPMQPALPLYGAHRVPLYIIVASRDDSAIAEDTMADIIAVACWIMGVPAPYLEQTIEQAVPARVIRSVPLSPIFSPNRRRSLRPTSSKETITTAFHSPLRPMIQSTNTVLRQLECALLAHLPPCSLSAAPAAMVSLGLDISLSVEDIHSMLVQVSVSDLLAVENARAEGVTTFATRKHDSHSKKLATHFAAQRSASGLSPIQYWARLVDWFRTAFVLADVCAAPASPRFDQMVKVVSELMRVATIHLYLSKPLIAATEAQEIIKACLTKLHTLLTEPSEQAAELAMAYGVDPMASASRSTPAALSSATAVHLATCLNRLYEVNTTTHLVQADVFYMTGLTRETALILHETMPHIVPFSIKERLVRAQVKFIHGPVVKMEVVRRNIVQTTREAFEAVSAVELQHDWRVEFKAERAIDVLGCRKELVTLLTKALFDDRTLFDSTPNGHCLVPNADLGMCRFAGQFFAKACRHSLVPSGRLAPIVLKMILGNAIGYQDLRDLDPDLYRNQIQFIRDNSVDMIPGLTFTDADGTDLVPGGSSIPVTDDNKASYIDLIVSRRLKLVSTPLDAFVRGFDSVCPIVNLGSLNSTELDLFLFGQRACSAMEVIDNIAVKNATRADRGVIMFFNVLASWPDSDVSALLHFMTGQRHPPAGGVAAFQPPLTVQVVEGPSRIPSASTCFNLLKITRFERKDVMEERLKMALAEGINAEFGLS
ncbi:HECT-domain (ubiquitin-transferase) [Carpediemonas membranifera]|uniref:HECT-type E3 ubiquitin transferase n=1 Tax=Carpediemonas membranifera TaxID=201153 RepID=A0A8J6BBQ8_9EUKA|nr:HECT-domain (ubiquitin-transferase) [Carpediemonas membranifera]|eukprot:KAG9396947.1 HECT-domain (ubiquitin-transferase) [Carpediemonas membranifera]